VICVATTIRGNAGPVIYLKSILAGIAAIAVSNILVLGISFLIIVGIGGYWGFDFSLAGLGTWAGALPTLLIFAAGFYWEFRRISKRHSSSR
jgi:hypothetical protein